MNVVSTQQEPVNPPPTDVTMNPSFTMDVDQTSEVIPKRQDIMLDILCFPTFGHMLHIFLNFT